MKERLAVLYEGESVEQIADFVEQLDIGESLFKVLCLNTMDLDVTKKVGHLKRREIERTIGLHIQGEAGLDHPKTLFGVVLYQDKWYFGKLQQSESIWFFRTNKSRTCIRPHSVHVTQGLLPILPFRILRGFGQSILVVGLGLCWWRHCRWV